MIGAISVRPVGMVQGGRTEPADDHWGTEQASIQLDTEQFTPDSLLGLDGFSHIEVVFRFHLVPEDEIVPTARHPRGRTEWPKVGIFAQRGRVRPNRIGVSICRLLKVEGLRIFVEGLDAIDGTPVIDVKPWMSAFGVQGAVREPDWAREVMREYW
jgi:tRNA (adenine37-N6)-methyltransferase